MNVGLFVAQDDLPGNSDSVEEVVDEAYVVDESVHVTGAQHEQGGQALGTEKNGSALVASCVFVCEVTRLTVKSRAGMGVQRFT